jgi:AcrR family transcriptional regulator
MPPKTKITDERILDAARDVFVERGVRATTAEVARRARVAEGSIFKRFKSKDELFFKAMQLDRGEPGWISLLRARAGTGDVRELLRDAAAEAIEFFRQILPLVIMSWSSQITVGGLPSYLTQKDPVPLRALRAVAEFFETEMRLGRLAWHDPEVVARAFLGSMQSFVFFEVLLHEHDQTPIEKPRYVHALADFFWSGMVPKASRAKRRPRSRK